MADPAVLSPGQFAEFHAELWPERPGAWMWQQRAARELAEGVLWEQVTVPAAYQPSRLIECLLFAWACGTTLPRRIFWVIDRRGGVDDTFAYARQIIERIRGAADGVLAQARQQLECLGAGTVVDGLPVQVRRWRGGLVGEAAVDADHDLPLSPCAPAIICTTVDMLGSRMLFRGYGVSRRSRPIEAALVSVDSLIVLDGTHCAGPLRETITAVSEMQGKRTSVVSPARAIDLRTTLATSANTPSYGERLFMLTGQERADPAVRTRTHARRTIELRDSRSDHAKSLASAARTLAKKQGVTLVGVIANTVSDARTVASLLGDQGEVLLSIGPARPLDRENPAARMLGRRERSDRKIFLVGTQILEAKLALDLDGLVTACAPLTALANRLAMLDHAGEIAETGTPAHGVIMAPPKNGCPVYGETTRKAWDALCAYDEQNHGTLNLNAETIEQIIANASQDAVEMPLARAPLLRPWHLDALTQTSHRVQPDPNVALFLRGERALRPPDVQVCWRADLNPDDPNTWPERVRIRPPHPGELLPISIGALHHWLTASRSHVAEGDVEGVSAQDAAASRLPAASRQVLRVPADRDTAPQLISLRNVHPGDLIVLPAAWGGCDRSGWAPDSSIPVTDLGNLAARRQRILISPTLHAPDPLIMLARETALALANGEITERDAYSSLLPGVREWMTNGGDHDLDTPAGRHAARIGGALSAQGSAMPVEQGTPPATAEILLVPRREHNRQQAVATLYATHSELVEKRMLTYTDALGIDGGHRQTLQLAARHHDLGKLDPRFQARLNGGWPADPAHPLAKPANDLHARAARRAAQAAGWPHGKRHEHTSATLLEAVDDWPDEVDHELLVHLALTHHGDGRPFCSYAPDPTPETIHAMIDNGQRTRAVHVSSDLEPAADKHLSRFVRLQDRYGPWGLAMLEMLVRLADRTVSAEGS